MPQQPASNAIRLEQLSKEDEQQTDQSILDINKILNAMEKHTNTKQEIKDIINKQIEEQKNDLIQVKSYIEEKFHKSLSNIDNAFIERKYIKHCLKCWLREAADFLKTLLKNTSRNVIQEIFNSLDGIQDLYKIPNNFKQLEYYILLMKHYKMIRKEYEKKFISRFKQECLEQIVTYSDSAKKELVLLEAFVKFLSSSKQLQSIIVELKLKDFCSGNLPFDKLINNILKLKSDIYGEMLTVLQEAAKGLKLEDIFLIDKFKEVISAYTKPVTIQEKKADDRLIVEVLGKSIVLSEIVKQLENALVKNPNIEEVRFVGADIMHIDADLKNEVWHGRNIAILAKEIKLLEEVTWNVSGKDNNFIYTQNAGTEINGHGNQGKDGYPGESGGNVLILVENIINPAKFTIISNGGQGCKGQNGGDGKDGENGKSLTKIEFDEKFPAAAKLMHPSRKANIFKTVTSIKEDLQEITAEWYETERCTGLFYNDVRFENNVIKEIIEDCTKLGTGLVQAWLKSPDDRPYSGNIFINAKTTQGNEITFSYERGGMTTNCQAFLIYKGSLGQPGGNGGEYGLGGQGGYAGEIITRSPESNKQRFNITRNTKNGKDGENGLGGSFGKHGENGWDMGYMDYSMTEFLSDKWPKFYGADLSSKLSLDYWDTNAANRIRCPYKERKGSKYIYAQIGGSRIEQQEQKQYVERQNTRQNNDRQHHAQAVRKKNISQNSILSSYSHLLNSMEKNTLQNLESALENTKQQGLEAIAKNQELQKKQIPKIKIKRHTPYQNKSTHYNEVFIKPNTTYEAPITIETVLDKIAKEPFTLDNWFQLRKTAVNLSELSNFFSIFDALKDGNRTNDEKIKLQTIEKFLLDKYQLATLEEITQQLPPYQQVANNVELMAESAIKYLIEAKENDNKVSHPMLGTLNQYLFENSKTQRENISKFCKEELQLKDNTTLKSSVREFVLEAGSLEGDVAKYHNKYKYFFEKCQHDSIIFSESFDKLDDECCKNKNVLKAHAKYLEEKGPLSGSYRELLAHIFHINIRLYAENQDNKLYLQDDHNPSSKKIIHLLCRDNTFLQLNIDKNYFKLEEERKQKDNLYAQIFAKIKTFKTEQEFIDYVTSKEFLSNNNLLNEEFCINEKEDIVKILQYFPEEEKQQLKERLEKITSQYIGQQEILYNILKRFVCEQRHVSSQELSCLINLILTYIIDDRKVMNVFCWIVAAYPQKCWIDELMLLQLEDYFKKPLPEKVKWRQYLSMIENKNILLLFQVKLNQYKSSNCISMQCIEDTLHLLSNIPNERVSLEGLELSEWSYALKEKYWTCKLSKLVNWQSDELPIASYYLLSIENIFGTLLTEKLLAALEKKKQQLISSKIIEFLSHFHHEKWNLSEDEINTLNVCSIDKWSEKMQQKFSANKKERKITQLLALIKGNTSAWKKIFNKLQKLENYIECIDKHEIAGKPTGSFTENDITKWAIEFKDSIGERDEQNSTETCKEILAVIDRAIELKRGFKLRDTQRLTVLALLTNDRNTLAQVSTGEGKSLIVVAMSIMKGLCGEKVDIITSSSVLAKRDAEDNRDIYNLFGINVSHNCSEVIEKRKEVYSSNKVIYGDLSNFQRDYLLDAFYGMNILGDHNFQNVFIDEVDSMLLDKGNNMLYLSHDLAGLDKLESLYIYIWQWITRPATSLEEIYYSFDVGAIKDAVLNELHGVVKKDDIGKLGSELNEQQKCIIWARLIEAEILDGQGKLLKRDINDNDLNQLLSSEFDCYKDRLHRLLKECIEQEKFIHVPYNLKSFIEQHLESWIKSAINAFFMKAGEDYVVDVDKTGSSSDRNPNITILDRDTGTDQANSQWDEALHQFLQLKHGCKLSLQSLKAVFISNVSFFKRYNKLYGLTGTLGSRREGDLLQEIHEVDFITIPTARPKQFHEVKPILCSNKAEWINKIHDEVENLTKERSVLIICETVNDVETLYKAFGGKNEKHVHTYTRDYEAFDEGFEIVHDNKELKQGQIIIATNLAGRGTDIKLTKELRNKGGLHVCLTYLPNNMRIEQQAFGRAARSGDEGSGQLIIMCSKGQEYSSLKVLDLRRERDVDELHRISDMKAYYDTQISTEENCFKSFTRQYEQLKYELDDKKVPKEVKEILLQTCLDKWTFWLDRHNKYIKELSDENDKRKLNNLLNKFISQLKSLDTDYESWFERFVFGKNNRRWLAWVEGNPIQMIKLGKYFCQNKDLENAIELFNEVIEKEQYFSEAAHYYKAFALAKSINWEKKPLQEDAFKKFKHELHETARHLDKHCQFSMNAAGIIGKIKKNNKESIIQIDAYEEQQKNLANLYYIFSRSIDDIFGHSVTPQSFVNNYDINDDLAETLYMDLIENNILENLRVEENIDEKKVKVVSAEYGISFKILNDFLSNYRGKQINEKEFQKSLKKNIKLPDRKEFWKLLMQGEALNEEVKYVAVNIEKLKEMDPSLFDYINGKLDQKELEKQTMGTDHKQIILNIDWDIEKNDNIFKKDDFIKIVGKDKYKVLKEKGILSFNKKAHINQSKMESITFPCYDSIILEDFTKINITRTDAETILTELIQENVLEKKEKLEGSTYALKINFDQINHVQLPSCRVYENTVKALLHSCFAYRIALQRIIKHLNEKNFPIRLRLVTEPHQTLFYELLEQKIIRSVTVTAIHELENKLKHIYNRTMSKDNFTHLLLQSKLIPEKYIEELFDLLVEKEWICNYNPILPIENEGIAAINMKNVGNIGKSLFSDLYYINSPNKRQKPLNFSLKMSLENQPIDLQNIDKTVEKILDNRLQLMKNDAIKNIVSALTGFTSSLKLLEVPNSNLKPLSGCCDFGNIDEVNVFTLNGLNQLLQLEEKKWTKKMLLNTAIVTAMGLSQIAIGTVIELYSVGMMTHVGAAFINEGVSDIFFAAGALKSGHFSWKGYAHHKMMSLMTTAVTVGIGAYLSRGAKFSRFGYKTSGPQFECSMKVVEMSGKQLIDTVGMQIIGKEVAKRIAIKFVEGIAFGLTNLGIDMVVENCLKAFCENIASTVLSDIERTVDSHNISTNVERAYKVLGKEKAKKVIEEVTKSVFARKNHWGEFISTAAKIANGITQGILEAVKKQNRISTDLHFSHSCIAYYVCKALVWVDRARDIVAIKWIAKNLLNDLNQEIEDKLNKLENDKKNKKNEIGNDYINFKKEIINHWKSLLHERVGNIIAQQIVSPVLKGGANYLVRYAGKKVQETYRSFKEKRLFGAFEEKKQEYEEKIKGELQGDNESKTKNDITKKYHDDLRKLMIKSKNPYLLAAIIRENVPMDLTCVNACTRVIHKLLATQGIEIPGLTIIVEGEGGIRQSFTSGSKGIIITLNLKNNHFTFNLNEAAENANTNQSENNCLYEAVVNAIPQLKNMTPQEFRNEIASCIETDPNIQYHIRQGWHQLPIRLGAFGGAAKRERTDWVNDPESSSFDGAEYADSDSFCNREHSVSDHLEDRFTRYFRFSGILQQIAEETNIRVDEIIEGGASQYQDRSSRRGPDIHAAHVVRAGKINPKLPIHHKRILQKFLGHTQNVPKYANEYHGIGGDIDKFQSRTLKELNRIDFSKGLTMEDAEIIKKVTQEYISLIDKRINGRHSDDRAKIEFIKTKNNIKNIGVESFFEKGHKGYLGKGMDPYR